MSKRHIIGRWKFSLLILGMLLVPVATILITCAILYKTAFHEEELLLSDNVRSQSFLIEAMARFNKRLSQGDGKIEADQATLAEIQDAYNQTTGFDETGEFLFGKIKGDQIVLLLKHRVTNIPLQPVDVNSELAEPMRRALAGQSGAMVGRDYDGIKVLAAYAYIEKLGLGIVAKKNLSEIREPFIRAGLWAGGIGFVLILIGVFIFLRIRNLLIRDLETALKRFQNLAANLHGTLLQFETSPGGTISIPYANPGSSKLFGLKNQIIKNDPQSILAATHPDDQELMMETFAKATGNPVPFSFAWRIIVKGVNKWVEGNFRPSEVRENGHIVWDGIVLDITTRKEAEDALTHLRQFKKLKGLSMRIRD